MNNSYSKRASLAGLLIFCIFLLELGALLYNSSIGALFNENVVYYKKTAEERMDKANVVMGDIYDRNGTALVKYESSIMQDKGTYLEPYMYSSTLGYCRSGDAKGILGKYESILRTTPRETDTKGYSLVLTLDDELQKAVYEALVKRIGKNGRGSMVVMDAETGEILSMVSTPVFDASDVTKEMEWMNDPEKSNGVWYPLTKVGDIAPGSTFKLISSIVMIENGLGDFTTSDDTVYNGNGYTVSNYGSYNPRAGEIGIKDALRKSSNVFFIKALLHMDQVEEKLTKKAKAIWLGDTLELDFGTVISSWTYDEDTWEAIEHKKVFNEERELATSLFGQSEIRMSCVQGAMLAAGIVNGGSVMVPYMVESVVNENGKTFDLYSMIEEKNQSIKKAAESAASDRAETAGTLNTEKEIIMPAAKKGEQLSVLTSQETADQVLEYMKNAAVEQYGFDPELGVAAKSGTSETGNSGNGGNNAWMVSSAVINGHKYAIAVNWANAVSGIAGSDMKVPVQTIYQYLKNK